MHFDLLTKASNTLQFMFRTTMGARTVVWMQCRWVCLESRLPVKTAEADGTVIEE
jgi:hypothetical protein